MSSGAEGTVTLTLTDEYQNMECIIKDHMYLIDYAREACAKANVPEDISPTAEVQTAAAFL